MTERELEIQELRDPDSAYGRQAFALYEDAFPAQEREPLEHIAAKIRESPTQVPPEQATHFSIVVTHSTVIGLAIFAYHHDVRLSFLEYMAVHPSAQGKGCGSWLFDRVIRQSAEDALRLGGPSAFGVCFEVERPMDAPSEAERRMRERRIRFYLRNGAQLIKRVEFLAPPLGQGLPPVPYHLMFRPNSSGPVLLTNNDIEHIIETVLLHGYGLPRDSIYFKNAIASIQHKG